MLRLTLIIPCMLCAESSLTVYHHFWPEGKVSKIPSFGKGVNTDLVASRASSTSAASPKSTLSTDTPSAREKPVPLAVQSFRAKALATCLPSKPVAPVTKATFSLMIAVSSR